MIKLSDYKGLYGKDVKIVCMDNEVFIGRWSECFSAEENAEHAIDNNREPPGESILIGNTEIYASDIKSIEAVESTVSVTIAPLTDARRPA
jgi:uncharacterized protein YegP (UPF0339 family)